MDCFVPVKRLLAFSALVAPSLLLAAPINADSDSRSARARSMTGVWVTEGQSPFVIRLRDGPHIGFTAMRWELSEDADGLIVGVNINATTSSDLPIPAPGAQCIVGARNLRKVVISESDLNEPALATFIFSCEQKGRNRLRCLGHALSSLEPVAMQADLVRLKNPAEVLEPIANLARERCQPAG